MGTNQVMTYAIEMPFAKALKRVRTALRAGDLEIAGELQLVPHCRLLLVDCPLLVFEGLALDRAAGVYFPLHVMVRANGAHTEVSTMASESSDARLPAGAAGPIERLEQRVADALDTLAAHSH